MNHFSDECLLSLTVFCTSLLWELLEWLSELADDCSRLVAERQTVFTAEFQERASSSLQDGVGPGGGALLGRF